MLGAEWCPSKFLSQNIVPIGMEPPCADLPHAFFGEIQDNSLTLWYQSQRVSFSNRYSPTNQIWPFQRELYILLAGIFHARTGSPKASYDEYRCLTAKAAIKAVIVPSPPPSMGSKSNVASGSALENPALIASATL